MAFKPNNATIYITPIIFGAALCPIQNLQGHRYSGIQEHVKQYTVIYEVNTVMLNDFLPPKMNSIAPHLIVRFEELDNVAWLAGRTMRRIELLTPVMIDNRAGLFNMVTWENNGDSILCDRDIKGQAKVFAEISIDLNDNHLVFKAQTWSFVFIEADLSLNDASTKKELPSYLNESHGTYYYRYLPKTGEGFTQADVEYIVFSKNNKENERRQLSGTHIRWFKPKFEDAPTQHYYLQKIADMQPNKYMCSFYREFDRNDDGYDQTIVGQGVEQYELYQK